MNFMWFPFAGSFAALLFVVYLAWYVLKMDKGNERMQEISRLVQDGAKAFLKREYLYVSIFVGVTAVLIAAAPFLKPGVDLGWKTSVAFLAGAFASTLAGYIGMSIATRANSRTAQAAYKSGLREALSVAVSGGAVMGMSVVGLALLGLCIVYVLFKGEPGIINGYAMGTSFVALFARSGGGIYTKGADMGADLVGKVESGMPEDDPRNPAVIADNVGDNVGDVAGLGADLLESYVESIVASIAIAGTIGIAFPSLKLIPLFVATAGIGASILGIFWVRFFSRKNPQSALTGGTYFAAALTIIATYFIVRKFGVPYDGCSQMGPFYATLLGILSGMAIGFTSEFFTSSKFAPVKKLAKSAQTGPAIAITEGFAIGMESTAFPIIVLAVSVMLAHHFAGIYGIAMAAVGMLATTGIVVAVDSYGPIADNAGGNAEMAKLPSEVRDITDELDTVGNTTAAIGKGFAIGSAAFAAIGLLVAFMAASGIKSVDIRTPRVMAGLFIGGMLPFLFSSMLFRAVGRCAFQIIDEVRRQIREIPGLMEGKVMPDSTTCVDISTKSALNGMMLPGILVIVVPVITGLSIGAEGLAGVLTGSLITGVMLGIQNANAGGAMDNAKKYIEEGNFGGKNTPTHAASVIADTVGDPLKDTVGPSINILIKLMAVISLVIAPLL